MMIDDSSSLQIFYISDEQWWLVTIKPGYRSFMSIMTHVENDSWFTFMIVMINDAWWWLRMIIALDDSCLTIEMIDDGQSWLQMVDTSDD